MILVAVYMHMYVCVYIPKIYQIVAVVVVDICHYTHAYVVGTYECFNGSVCT